MSETPPVDASGPSDESQACILVIDDCEEYRRLAKRRIENLGFCPYLASGGALGLDLARDLLPDVILLDLHMPDLSGFEVLRQLHDDVRTWDIPVVCITGEPDPRGLLKDASLGMQACSYLEKSCTTDEFRSAVQKAFSAKPARRRTCGKPELELRRGPLRADRLERKVWFGEREIKLVGNRQFPLLWLLMSRSGPATQKELLRAVWPDIEPTPVKLRMAIMRLRGALEAAEAPCAIETLEHGYQLVVEGESAPLS